MNWRNFPAAALAVPKEENEAMETDAPREEAESSSPINLPADGPSQENGGG